MKIDVQDLEFFWFLLMGVSALLFIGLGYLWGKDIFPDDRDKNESISTSLFRFAKRAPIRGGLVFSLFMILLVSAILMPIV